MIDVSANRYFTATEQRKILAGLVNHFMPTINPLTPLLAGAPPRREAILIPWRLPRPIRLPW